MPTSVEALKSMCENCERSLAGRKQLCPFRSISGDYCEEYEAIERELKAFSILKQAYDCGIFWLDKQNPVICCSENTHAMLVSNDEYILLKHELQKED